MRPGSGLFHSASLADAHAHSAVCIGRRASCRRDASAAHANLIAWAKEAEATTPGNPDSYTGTPGQCPFTGVGPGPSSQAAAGTAGLVAGSQRGQAVVCRGVEVAAGAAPAAQGGLRVPVPGDGLVAPGALTARSAVI